MAGVWASAVDLLGPVGLIVAGGATMAFGLLWMTQRPKGLSVRVKVNRRA